jgi:hypothetical protein
MDVHFEIHRAIGHSGEELAEEAIAQRVAGDPAYVEAVRELDGVEGALVIGAAQLLDDLSPLVQRLCFEAVAALAVPGAAFTYLHYTSAGELELLATDDAVAIRGTQAAPATHPRGALLRALYACGLRYLAFLEQVGRDHDAAYLRPFADQARAAIGA